MQREISFRGKRIDNGEWVEGNLINKISPHEVGNVFWCSLIHDGALTAFEVDPETVGQYTGLLDKNGTKIFEGDIYIRFNYIYRVIFSNQSSGFKGLCIGREYDFNKGKFEPIQSTQEFDLTEYDVTEIIGNIHDTPELLG